MSQTPGHYGQQPPVQPHDSTRQMPSSGGGAGGPYPPYGEPRPQQRPLPPELSPRGKPSRRQLREDQARDEQGLSPAYERGRPRLPRGRQRFGWGKRIALTLAVLLTLCIALFIYWDGKLTRVDALPGYHGRPKDTAGTNWLLVGADARSGLSEKQKKDLATGDAAGSRTDTIMLVHTGSGPTSLISLPRDSFVPIAGHGRNKLNAAYSFGGAPLLTRTVEEATGLRVDHFAQIGFGGFAGMVDAVGGVHICVEQRINDPKAGLNLSAGCQKLNGPQALGYVRTRATANADLDRVKHQRQFLSALVAQSVRPGVLLNPFRSISLGSKVVDSLTVDNGTHMLSLAQLGLAMRGLSGGKGVTATVPIASTGSAGGVGDVVNWDRPKAQALFGALAKDKPIPEDLISR